MKKALSIFLAFTMVLTLASAAFAVEVPGVTYNPEESTLANNGVRVAYNFIEKSPGWNPVENEGQGYPEGTPNANDIYGITYEYTGYVGDGNWEYFGTSLAKVTSASFKMYGAKSKDKEVDANRLMLSLAKGTFIGFTIKVPEAGLYDVDFQYSTFADSHASAGTEIYIIPKPASIEEAKTVVGDATPLVSDFSYINADNSKVYAFEDTSLGKVEFSAAGEYVVIFSRTENSTGGSNVYPRRLILNSTGKTAPVIESAAAAKTQLNVGETTTVTYTPATRMSDATAAPENGIVYTFKSETPSVASVDDAGNVKAISAGEAVISVSASYEGAALAKKVFITVTSNEPELPSNVLFSAAVDGGLADIEGYENNYVASFAVGSAVTVSAPEIDGFEFKYWKTNSGYVSDSAEYSFNIYTNTWLYAVYAPIVSNESSQVSVDFFNGNGNFLKNIKADKGLTFAEVAKPSASLTGYVFSKWSIDDSTVLDNNVTAVALFEDTGNTSEKLTVNGAESNAVYGEKVSVSDDDTTYWTRDGKIVSYAKNYTFYAWGGASVIEKHTDAVEAKPVVVLDDDKVDGAYMIEYDVPAGYTKVEAGIVFGNTSSIEVNSCLSKAVSRRNDSHGQFTASPNGSETVARGYIIYKNSAGEYKIVYSD